MSWQIVDAPSKPRDAGAAFSRATQRQGNLTLTLGDTGSVAADVAGQAVVEGALLARYRYDVLKARPTVEPITELVLVVDGRRSAAVRRGAARGVITTEATNLARDLANTPPALLDAIGMAELASRLGKKRGLKVEIFDKQALQKLECGGLLGVNAGSAEPPGMIKLEHRPRRSDGPPGAGRQGNHV